MPKTTTEKPTPRRRRRLPDERFRDQLCKTVIALPLLEKMQRAIKPLPIIIDLNYGYLGGLRSAKKQACLALLEVLDPAREVTLAVAGNPNSGKSTLINAVAGTRLQVGNWPGVTVEKKEAAFEHAGGQPVLRCQSGLGRNFAGRSPRTRARSR